MKFKVGDRVKMKSGENVGLVGIITEIRGRDIYPFGVKLETPKYNYNSTTGDYNDLGDNGNLELISSKPMKKIKITHIVRWSESSDPTKDFGSLEDAKKFIKKTLLNNSYCKKDSIEIIEVKKIRKVTIGITLK